MNGIEAFFKSIKDAFTDPNGYWCLPKVGGGICFGVGIAGFFLRLPGYMEMVIAGLTSFSAGKGLDATVKPETPEQAAK